MILELVIMEFKFSCPGDIILNKTYFFLPNINLKHSETVDEISQYLTINSIFVEPFTTFKKG